MHFGPRNASRPIGFAIRLSVGSSLIRSREKIIVVSPLFNLIHNILSNYALPQKLGQMNVEIRAYRAPLGNDGMPGSS